MAPPRARLRLCRLLFLLTFLGTLIACVRDVAPRPPPPASPPPPPEAVVESFFRHLEQDTLTLELLDNLVSVESFAEGIELEGLETLTANARRARLLEALLLVLRGSGALRQHLIDGSLVFGHPRILGSTALVEVYQRLPTGDVHHEVELEFVDERWKIRGFRDADGP